MLEKKHILLLGEAGYGKTYESIDLLGKICSNHKSNSLLLPVYLPLFEFGKIYSSIKEGIKYKLNPFCKNISDNFVRQLLKNDQVVLILDGIDDIQTFENKSSFIAEINNIILQYENCYVFITSRFNRYNDELGNISKYCLKKVSKKVINKQLRDANIFTKIPNCYIELFENPMFLNVGKTVLKYNHHRELFNRSILFDELMILLCGESDKKKRSYVDHPLCYAEMINLLGHYAFDTFYQPSSSLLEFDKYISDFIDSEKKSLIINCLLGSELLKVTDRITFAHKLFKEYCAAYYLVNTYPLSKYQSKYLDLINCDEWKEVFIFASGMFNNFHDQDIYLDFVTNNNLQLYIECVNAKSDLSKLMSSTNKIYFIERYLNQIVRTYSFIINKYFKPIEHCFDPRPGKREKKIEEKKIRIVGHMSHNGYQLYYWFDRVLKSEKDSLCINKSQIAKYQKSLQSQAKNEHRNTVSYFLNLKNSGLIGDSGRKVAVDLIKKQIKGILRNKELNENKYLMCERLENNKRKIKELKDLSDLKQMYYIVDNIIEKAKIKSPDLIGYTYNNVELFKLRFLIKEIIDNNINYNECLLPKVSSLVTESYENEQEEFISKFFYFHQLSYIKMVEINFPILCYKFSRYLDTPYQNIILIHLEEKEDKKNILFNPSLTYYYIASSTDKPIIPQLRCVNTSYNCISKSKEICNEIKQSYLNKGRKPNKISWIHTGFSFITSSKHIMENEPLSDCVYESIKDSIEEVLGEL